MANQLIPVQWEKPLRKSAVNTLDKVNELVDYINNSDIHELSLIESASGEEVMTGTSTALAGLTVYGKSVQDGTPSAVGAYQMLKTPYAIQLPYTHRGVTYEDAGNGGIHVSGTATGGDSFISLIQYNSANNNLVVGETYTLSANGTASIKSRIYSQNQGTKTAQYITYTVADESWNMLIVVLNGGTVDEIVYPAINTGSEPKPYTPYGCIGLQINDTITPVDLQGHTLPEGDTLNIDSVGQVTLEHIETSTIIDLGTIDMPAIPSGSTVSILASLTPVINVSWWTEQAIPMLIKSLKSYIDSKIDAVNTRINELHGITSMARPIATLTDKVSPDIINIGDEIGKLDTTEEEEQ